MSGSMIAALLKTMSDKLNFRDLPFININSIGQQNCCLCSFVLTHLDFVLLEAANFKYMTSLPYLPFRNIFTI